MTAGNEGQVHQIIVNLIDNALDAVRGAKTRMWSVCAGIGGGRGRDSVSDNGAGIADVAFDKMFEPFFTTKTVGEGTGLGLWISWSIAREHGGSHRGGQSVRRAARCSPLRLPVGG